MCVVKKPQIPTSPDDNKPLPILRNPFLDGMLGNIAAIRNGRDSLRIPLNPLGIPVGGGAGGGVVSGVGGGGTSGGSTSGGGSFSGGSVGGGSTAGSGGNTSISGLSSR